MSQLEIFPIACLRDNYAYRLTCTTTGYVAVVDPSEGEPMMAALEGRLDAILNTHHHWDHTGGNEALLSAFPEARVYGHASDEGRIPGQTDFLEEGAVITVGNHKARILHIPGHTTGAIAYHFRDDVFTGDTLFIAGCGRLFEGTPDIMHRSLQRLAALPEDTRVWVGHEYTVANLHFAQTVEPDNPNLDPALRRAQAARNQNRPTIPSSIGLERQINPFIRAENVAEFAQRRQQKDSF